MDSDHIDNVLAHVEAFWRNHPHWRFGQILANIGLMSRADLFYLNDEDLLLGLKTLEVMER